MHFQPLGQVEVQDRHGAEHFDDWGQPQLVCPKPDGTPTSLSAAIETNTCRVRTNLLSTVHHHVDKRACSTRWTSTLSVNTSLGRLALPPHLGEADVDLAHVARRDVTRRKVSGQVQQNHSKDFFSYRFSETFLLNVRISNT